MLSKERQIKSFKATWDNIPVDQQTWRKKYPYEQLVVEIGAGAGLHAIQFAKLNSDVLIIPIERTQTKANKLLNRVKNHPDLNNVYPVYSDAVQWISQNIKDNELSEVYILYPNPYPKSKHANKRFFNMPFMQKIISALKPGGKIILATNIYDHYAEAKKMGAQCWGLLIVSDRMLPNDFLPRTHFEKKYLARGECCYEVIFQKEME